jgi:hypothetical protein
VRPAQQYGHDTLPPPVIVDAPAQALAVVRADGGDNLLGFVLGRSEKLALELPIGL